MMTINFTVAEVHGILLGYTLEQGESIWEELESDFYGNEGKYLEFLVSKNYITTAQQSNWFKHRYGDCEYENIEAMTYASLDSFPYDLVEKYDLFKEGTFELDHEKTVALGLVNVPIFIHTTNVEEFHQIYWDRVLYVIAEYLQSDLETYGKNLNEMLSTVKYYRGE